MLYEFHQGHSLQKATENIVSTYGDKKWVMFKNIRTYNQWLDPGQRPIGVPWINRFQRKALLCVWWNKIGGVYFELLDEGQVVNSEVYCRQLEAVNQQLIENGFNPASIRFIHDNARPHVSRVTQAKLKDLNWHVLPHAPYSPDLAPSDYHLFSSLEHSLRDTEFDDLEQLENWIHQFFESKHPDFYERGLKDLVRRWRSVVKSESEYIIDQWLFLRVFYSIKKT